MSENSELNYKRDHPEGDLHIVQHIIDDLLNLDVEGDVWDDVPLVLFVLDPGPDDPDKHRVAILDITPEFWVGKDVPVAIHVMAAALTMPGSPLPPIPIEVGDEIVGIILRSEGWMLKGTPENRAEIEAWTSSGKRIVDHPAAIEVKQYVGVTGTETFFKQQARHEEVSEWYPGSEGRVPEVLNTLLTAARTRYSS